MTVLTSDKYALEAAEALEPSAPATSVGARAFKRTLDLAAGLVGVALFGWLFVLIALAIRLDSPGAVFFKQERLGKDRKPFTIYKFRTMVQDADQMGLAAREGAGRDGLLFKDLNDPRLTRVGRWLRQTSLDELPQLINILRGEMSLVGPRPLPVSDTRYYQAWQWGRLAVLPGLTGLWQVSGRSKLSSDQMVRLDLYYIEHWTPMLECFIILKTFWVLMTRDGAY